MFLRHMYIHTRSPLLHQPFLKGRFVQLEPLSLEHHLQGLCAVGLDPLLWRWTPHAVTDAEAMKAYVQTAMEERDRGVSIPFVTTLPPERGFQGPGAGAGGMRSRDGLVPGAPRGGNIDDAIPSNSLLGKVVGSTRFGNIDLKNRKLEIGWTWVSRPWQRTAVNTEAKLLMLTYAFEQLRCIRVEFKTDALNLASRKAIARLGAKEEGVLRRHMITETGRFRDSVYFSILDDEWPAIKRRLEDGLLSYASSDVR